MIRTCSMQVARMAACAASVVLVAAGMPARSATDTGLQASVCPGGLVAESRCLSGRDEQGAYVWLAVPPFWSGTLVVHAQGGPELGPPKAGRAKEDLQRWSIWNRAGYAFAGSGYRQGGVAVTSAAEDIERARSLFVAAFGQPRRTVLHGQSWGAGVAAKAAEIATVRAASGAAPMPYDAVLLTSGVLGGGTGSYDFRLDLRVVYEAVCRNHPPAEEAPYPLWQGLPPDRELTRTELALRVDACTGLNLKPVDRSPLQQSRLDTITRVVRIDARSLQGHIAWGTWHFQDIVFKRLGGRNPFGNLGVRYTGSADDEALNAAVARYAADPSARADFAADADLSGRIGVPVLTMHAVGDPTAFVELESFFRARMQQGGSVERLVQIYTDDHEHSYLSDAQYVSAMAAVMAWIERGDKPTPQAVAANCAQVAARFDPSKGCRWLPDYQPAPMAERVPLR